MVEGKTEYEIADECGVGRSTVQSTRNRLGIKREVTEPYKNKEWLIQQVDIENKTIKEILDDVGCSRGTLRYWANKLGIELKDETALKYTHAHLMSEWDYEKNDKLNLLSSVLGFGSKKSVHWKCSKCSHEYYDPIKRITSRRGEPCPICSGIVDRGKPIFEICPHLEEEWDHEENEKYGFKPESTTSKTTHYKVFWKSEECGHSWSASPASRTRGSGCPECLNVPSRVEDSFAYIRPDLAKQWDYERNEKTPLDYKPRSSQDVYWKCDVCPYKWRAAIGNRYRRDDSLCPDCNNTILNERYNLMKVFPLVAAEWDYDMNYPLIPEEVFPVSGENIYWLCENNHSYKATVANRTSGGTGCTECQKGIFTSYGEQAVYYYVKKVFSDAVNRHTFSHRKEKIEYDIYIPSLKIAIEYDGFHYHNTEKRYRGDKRKNIIANLFGDKMFRIREYNLESIPISINILNTDRDYKDLDDVITKLFKLILESYKDVLADSQINSLTSVDVEHDSIRHKIINEISVNQRENSLLVKFPEIAKEWHPNLNQPLTPDKVSYGTNTKVWWICPNGHEHDQSVSARTGSGSGCRYCTGQFHKRNTSAGERYPELISLYHPTLNGSITLFDVNTSDRNPYWWIGKDGEPKRAQMRSQTEKAEIKRRKQKLKDQNGE